MEDDRCFWCGNIVCTCAEGEYYPEDDYDMDYPEEWWELEHNER